jgi:4-hydroxy-tetrahydrodipicolinate reductase
VTAIWISGDGRMGSALVRLLDAADPAAAGLRRAESEDRADVVVDYSHPYWTGPLLDRLLAKPRPLVVGTTGLGDAARERLDALSAHAPVVVAPNTGTGINVLRNLVRAAAHALPGWDLEVLEMHHRKKVDAPSGTAWLLLEAAADGSDPGSGRERAVPSRVGDCGARTDREIGVQTLRGGDVVGEHTVYLVGHGERIELTHRAWDRDTFARGGLRAARWIVDQPSGRYGMADVLGL